MISGSARVRIAMLALWALLGAACGSSATAESPPLPGQTPAAGSARTTAWAQIVPGMGAAAFETGDTVCHRGQAECLEAIVAEMDARLAELGCEHTAPFAFTYLEMTKGVLESVETFDRPGLISIVDARFAELYFDAIDNWYSGNTADVPAAWQLAFATADRGESSAALDLILGMNAHISRDLAYVVAELAAQDPLVTDEPEDYRLVNEVIGDVKTPMLERAARRFDPSLFLLDTGIELDDVPDPVELIGMWRSNSFDLGLRLARAETDDDRRAVIAEIERTSTAAASVLIAAEAVEGLGGVAEAVAGDGSIGGFLTGPERDDYCAAATGL